jgi:hypothetical protein
LRQDSKNLYYSFLWYRDQCRWEQYYIKMIGWNRSSVNKRLSNRIKMNQIKNWRMRINERISSYKKLWFVIILYQSYWMKAGWKNQFVRDFYPRILWNMYYSFLSFLSKCRREASMNEILHWDVLLRLYSIKRQRGSTSNDEGW